MKKPDIKIVSQHSGFGGSTIALINLTNLLNESGYRCHFYGPLDWHIKHCKYGKPYSKFSIESDDIIIAHLRECEDRPLCKKIVLFCHEKWTYFRLLEKKVEGYDTVVFCSESQRQWHLDDGWNGSSAVIGNPLELTFVWEPTEKSFSTAGVIGSLNDRKQTHVSIQRALEDGWERVLLYGDKHEPYFSEYVQPLLSEKVVWMGLNENKKEIYNSVGCVYHSSKDESACLVLGECKVLGIPFFGNENTIDYEILTKQQILERWVDVLDLPIRAKSTIGK